MAGGGPRPPTKVTNPDGSTTVTSYADDGSATVKSVTTTVANQDGTKTQTRTDAAGNTVDISYFNSDGGRTKNVHSNSDGTVDVTTPGTPDAGGKTSVTTTYSGDGATPLARKTTSSDAYTFTTEYLNPDGSVKSTSRLTTDPTTGDRTTTDLNPDGSVKGSSTQTGADYNVAATKANNPGWDGVSGVGLVGDLKNPTLAGVIGNDVKGAVSGVKGAAKEAKLALDSTNPVGTPGLKNAVVTDKIFGDPNNGSIYSDDSYGTLLHQIAGYYGLGGVGLGTGGAAGSLGGTAASLSGATGSLQQSVAAAGALRDKFGNAYDAATPGVAPTITAAQAQAPSLVSYLAQQPVSTATAGQVGAIPQVVAPTIDMANAPRSVAGVATAGTATAAQAQAYLAQAAQAQAAQAEASKAEASLATASQLDPTKQAEFRDTQKQLVGYLNDAIAGKSPSVAELQLRDAEQRQEANQLGLAAAASRGGNSALAMRTAANNIARLNQGASADQALLRAKEIADARGQLGTAAEQGRGADINLADRNATLTTGVSQTNAGLLTGVSQSNAGLATDVSKANAGMKTDVSKTNAGLLTDVSNANAGRQTSVSQSNAGLQTDVSKTNATNQTSASQTNATNTTSASNTNANNLTSLLAKQADLQYQASHDNAGNALSAQETQAKLNTDVSLASALAKNTADLQTQRLSEEASASNALNSTTTNINNAKFLNDASASNASNALTQRQLDEKTKQDAASNQLTASGQTITGGSAAVDAAAKADAAQRAGLASLGSSIAWLTGGNKTSSSTPKTTSTSTPAQSDYSDGVDDGSQYSDRRLKTDVKDGTAGAQALLDTLTAKSFRYKDGGNAPGERPGQITGVMAQDVEKTKAGKPLVVNTPRGKAIDTVPATGTLMAMLATLNKRLDRVEGRRNV